jgi:hypothetical protein
MRVGQLKELIDSIDDDVEVCIEAKEKLYDCIVYEDDLSVVDRERVIIYSDKLDEKLNHANEKLKQEVVFYMKRAVQAERLLRENECFCPVLQRNEIRDFLKG